MQVEKNTRTSHSSSARPVSIMARRSEAGTHPRRPFVQETWNGPDRGLIFGCERGRQERVTHPDDALPAEREELVGLE